MAKTSTTRDPIESAFTPPSADEGDDLFGNLDRLRVPQDYAGSGAVAKAQGVIAVCKPNKQWFIRTHPDPAMRIEIVLLEFSEGIGKELFLVHPEMRDRLPPGTEHHAKPRLLITSITRQGTLFLWPIALPTAIGKGNEWSESALEAARQARDFWLKVVPNIDGRGYDLHIAESMVGDPEWPDTTLAKLLKQAFKQKVIDSPDHPVLLTLRGAEKA